ncbi:hypothetical protein [Streptomyces phaeochromogenes]
MNVILLLLSQSSEIGGLIIMKKLRSLAAAGAGLALALSGASMAQASTTTSPDDVTIQLTNSPKAPVKSGGKIVSALTYSGAKQGCVYLQVFHPAAGWVVAASKCSNSSSGTIKASINCYTQNYRTMSLVTAPNGNISEGGTGVKFISC